MVDVDNPQIDHGEPPCSQRASWICGRRSDRCGAHQGVPTSLFGYANQRGSSERPPLHAGGPSLDRKSRLSGSARFLYPSSLFVSWPRLGQVVSLFCLAWFGRHFVVLAPLKSLVTSCAATPAVSRRSTEA